MVLKKSLAVLIFLNVLIVSLRGDVLSQDANHKPDYPKLGGHEFIINNFISSPFIHTSLRSGLGFATSLQTEIPLLRFNDTSKVKIDADISFVSGSFEYQHAIQDWASLWVNLSGVARLGTNTASIFATGVTANTMFETGILFKLAESQKSILSSSVSIKNSYSTVLNIYPFIKGLLDSTSPDGSDNLVSSLNPLAGEVDLRAAFSPSRPWSILTYIQGGYGENIEVIEIKNKFNYEFGLSATYNLNTKNSFPLAIGAGFRFNSHSPTLEYTKRLTQYYMLQLAYTGRRDFLISFESLYTRIPVNYQDLTIKLSSFSFNWAYYF